MPPKLPHTIVMLPLLMSYVTQAQQPHSIPGSSAYTVSAGFPTSIFPSYYEQPGATSEPQPAIFDPVLNITFPLNLTNPETIPTTDNDPIYYPPADANLSSGEAAALVRQAIANISGIITGDTITGNCSKCQASLAVAQVVAQQAPKSVPSMLVDLCETYAFASKASCVDTFSATSDGGYLTQVLAFADVSGLDGQYICSELSSSFCKLPTASPLDVTNIFPKPKPANVHAPPASGKRVKVLHLSDFHLDPRYAAASEANCSASLCCRTNVHAAGKSVGQIELPAPLYGAYECDTPYYLGLAALQSIGPLTGTHGSKDPVAWTLYTGDLVSHDTANQLSRAYVDYTEVSIFDMFKEYIGSPVYAVLGNHDTNPVAFDAPHSLPGNLSTQFSWSYDHISSLWQHNGWVDSTTAKEARLHYGAYSTKNQYGLRIITLNTDFWYKSNYLAYINTSNPDVSGMLGFLIQELQSAEDCGERVWILGHVLPGWDGTNPLPNPTNLFYQIVDRYSPHVIANVFFGHTHEDQVMIYYANNGTNQSSDNALTTGWIGPSVTPLTNLNSGFRMYEVDTGSFEIYEAYTWFSAVSSFPDLNASKIGPTFEFEYSTRDAYIEWPESSPLDAKFWHAVTEAMQTNITMVEQFNTYQGKSSVMTPNCSSTACQSAKVCYMRSGSEPLGRQCPQGYGSVQSAFDPPKS